MELQDIICRVAEGLPIVDSKTTSTRTSARTGKAYLPGVKTMTEVGFVRDLSDWWLSEHPDDFNSSSPYQLALEVDYPELSRAQCDLTFSTDGSDMKFPEWAIEVKHISLAGDNGKNNDYNVQKMLSPYLKDRSLLHDIHRLTNNKIAKRQAVIGYSFDYDFSSCDESLKLHPDKSEVIKELRKVCRSVDPINGNYSIIPLIEFADEIFTSKKFTKTSVIKEKFSGAWTHPAGGKGWVFGWEI